MNKFVYLMLSIYMALQMVTPVQIFADDKHSICVDFFNKVNHGAVLVDVRTKEEFMQGSLSGSINVPYDQIDINLKQFPSDRNKEIVLYCKSGRRSELGKQTLAKLGYKNVINAGSYVDLLKCWNSK